MNIFLICPVRGLSENLAASISAYVLSIEQQGHIVYYPPRNTNQVDRTGYRVCRDNLEAIEEADEVHICWDGKSQGCLFDLGMAFALGKKIKPVIGLFPPMTKGKSFQSMVYDWEERQYATQ